MKNSKVKESFEENIKQIAYQYYVMNWIQDHRKQDEFWKAADSFGSQYSPNGLEGYDHFKDYLEENGFQGEMWACFDEFIDCEYANEGYMGSILPVYLLTAYRNDRKLGGAQTRGEDLADQITECGYEDIGKLVLSKANGEDYEDEPKERIQRCIGKEVANVLRSTDNPYDFEGARSMVRAITGETIEQIISEARHNKEP